MTAKLPLSLAVLLALSACAKQETPATDAPAAATPAPAAAVAKADNAADAGFELTMAKVDGFLAASKNLAAVEQADASLDSAMNASTEDGAAYAARLEASPKLREAIEQAGLSTRDYALTTESLFATLMAVGAQEAGMLKDIPAGIDPRHVEFVKANRAELERKLKGAGALEG